LVRLSGAVAVLLCLALAGPAAGHGLVFPRHFGSHPLSDAAAAARVKPSPWEPRGDNYRANHTVPTAVQLLLFHRKSDMPNQSYVTGDYTGTTDEILQWAAAKWGFSVRLFRAVSAVETWWHQSFVGDNGDSFGLFQVRVPYHCCLPFIRTSTAFNADYYGAILRAYFDGEQGWLNDVEHGRSYHAGDLWGSVGVWASGRWHMGTSDNYVQMVKQRVADQIWRTPDFANG
jgi:hypothetical protein